MPAPIPQLAEVVQLALTGMKPVEVAHKMKLPYNTVRDIIRRYTRKTLSLRRPLPFKAEEDNQFTLPL